MTACRAYRKEMSGTLATPGGRVDPFNLRPEDVRLSDIIHCLPMQTRYNGYTRKKYSVAQHCVLVARLAAVDHGGNEPLIRAALLHDAVETYTGDVVRPLKRKLPEFEELEAQVDETVWKSLGLLWHDQFVRENVERYDRMACILELQNLLFYVCEEVEEAFVPDRHRAAARPLLKFMSECKARRLFTAELRKSGALCL